MLCRISLFSTKRGSAVSNSLPGIFLITTIKPRRHSKSGRRTATLSDKLKKMAYGMKKCFLLVSTALLSLAGASEIDFRNYRYFKI